MRSMFALVLWCSACWRSTPAVVVVPPAAPPTEVAPAGCDQLVFDLLAGTINGLPATASQAEVKAALPCATGDTPDGASFNFGGGVFFGGHDLYVYTGNDFIEVRSEFRGTVTPRLLGTSAAEAGRQLGQVTLIARDGDGRSTLYSRGGGCVRVETREGVVTELGWHASSCEQAARVLAASNHTTYQPLGPTP